MPFKKMMLINIGWLFACINICQQAVALEFPVNDPNFQQCLTNLAQKNNWGSLDNVTEIECHSQKIASINGIEKFTHLKKLSIYNNQLTQVKLEKLPELRHINLAKNSLQSISLNELPALEELYVFNNKLTVLELAQLPALKLLKANENQLLNFNYHDLPQLEKIYIFNNKMVDFDIYHLPQLHYMDCRQNPMTTKLYEEMSARKGVTFLHDGNAKDWQ